MTMSNGRGNLRQYLICEGLFRICLLANFRYIVLQQLVLRSRFGAADAAAWLLTQDQHIRVHLQRANCQVQFRKRRNLT